MERKARVTIKDVARIAMVTPQTVSRALRDAPDIAESTKTRVLEIASNLNYVKNSTASALRRGSTRLIGIIYDNLINLYFSVMTDFIQFCLKERGYSMLTISVRSFHLNEEAYMAAVSHNVDGIISFLEPDEELTELIKSYNVPVLLFGRRTNVKRIDCIHTDDEEGGRLAAARLADDGCKNAVCITEALELTCAYDRYHGFEEELKRRGISKPRIVNPNVPGLEQQLLSLMKSPEGFPDGIFCFNDMLAFETLYFIEKNNLPSVKVIGYDNVQQEIHIPRRLTTVGTDKLALAKRATEMIISKVETGDTNRAIEKKGVFLVEGTTA
ncbi:MAG: LacI family DNA-binding transcriptional regulator [Firmicutes bacterium]|jgi:periplasmic binding protein/lacI transcriptional regulator|nr:LacI family DNA-binding transcriptional regulator [Bacillota bacterium]